MPVQVAAAAVVEFMKNVDSNTMLCLGRDIVTMNNFMRVYGSNWNKWKDVSKYPVDTEDFFKKVQAELDVGKCKMDDITEMHGWPAI